MAKLKHPRSLATSTSPRKFGQHVAFKIEKKTANQFIKSSQLFFLESLYRNFPSMENVVTNYIRSFLKGVQLQGFTTEVGS